MMKVLVVMTDVVRIGVIVWVAYNVMTIVLHTDKNATPWPVLQLVFVGGIIQLLLLLLRMRLSTAGRGRPGASVESR